MLNDVNECWISSSSDGDVSVLNSDDGYTTLEVRYF